jgi:hypothetical protein
MTDEQIRALSDRGYSEREITDVVGVVSLESGALQVKKDKASGTINDPNDWSREHKQPFYINPRHLASRRTESGQQEAAQPMESGSLHEHYRP